MDATATFLKHLDNALQSRQLEKLTLSKPFAQRDWRNVYARPVVLKDQLHLSCTLRYTTRDETKNFSAETAPAEIAHWLGDQFRQADLFAQNEHWSWRMNKKGKTTLLRQAYQAKETAPQAHDQRKQRALTTSQRPYLAALGIAGQDGKILQKGQRKFRQINKYIELIGHLLKSHPLPPNSRIVDMGSGKGYLTFALYDHLTNNEDLDIQLTGIELRPALVEYCNDIAQQSDFTRLEFIAQDIHDYQPDGGINMLIALHACDTATDEAIYKGIKAEADIIVVAPCCHKQVRKAMRPPMPLQPMLRHGILLERQAEMLTDAIRALLLEAHGYRTKVFEFVGTEHTPKNVMITAVRDETNEDALAQVRSLKDTFGVDNHYLENLLAQ